MGSFWESYVFVTDEQLASKTKQPVANSVESAEEMLRRLSKKPGVKAWLMLDQSTGAVLKSSGNIAAVRPARASLSGNADDNSNNNDGGSNGNNPSSDAAIAAGAPPSTPNNNNNSGSGGGNDSNNGLNSEAQAAQELAALIWNFLSTAGSMVGEVDTEVCFFLCYPLLSAKKQATSSAPIFICTAGC